MKKRKDSKTAAAASAASSTASTRALSAGRRSAPAATASGIDLEAVRELARIAEEFGLTEVEADPSGRVRVSRRAVVGAAVDAAPSDLATWAASGPVAAGAAAPALVPAASAGDPAAAGIVISSPFVGTFYRSPSPEAASFVDLGQTVKKGQVVCIVEAMKLMNEIEAEADGKVAEILVKNGEHVEYGQVLFRLTPI